MYIASGVLGFVASQFAHIGGGGASGAVAGILGCTIVKRRLTDGHFQHPLTMQAIQLVLLNALFGLAISKVNNTAHLGGLLTGALLGLPFARFEGRALARRVWQAGAALCGGLVLASVAAIIVTPPPPSASLLQRGWLCANKGLDALDESGAAFLRGPAIDAVRCFEGLPPIADALDPSIAAMKQGLELALAGEREASTAKQKAGVAAFQEAYVTFASWLEGRGYLHTRLPEGGP
jgi:hypothetical protein